MDKVDLYLLVYNYIIFEISFCMTSEDFDYDFLGIMEDLETLRAPPLPVKLNMDKSNFPSLDSYHENAKLATEKTYPWIAQVIHSKTKNYPYICTAACVYDGVFITASRCIFRSENIGVFDLGSKMVKNASLKVKHTSVLYHSKRHDARAFVVPSKKTAQQFDDIGFIVLEKRAGVTFNVTPLYSANEVKRTDESFNWFSKLNFAGPFKVVGYVMDKANQRLKTSNTTHSLRELPVVVNMDLCWNILTSEKRDSFHVPCYHSCSLAAFKKVSGKCVGYLGVEGAAVVNNRTKKVLGLATWGPKYREFDLPVGFSVVNSKAFLEDFECAKKVRNAKSRAGSYQDLCKR